ncbi:titin-like [Mytilus trossulus]|uniref:titin-like n=1 Tax=Mytilus trossulus TaxID=6551 RepID=UPI003004B40A
MTLRVESNPDSKIMFRSSLLKIQQINKGNVYTDYTCNLPFLKCEDSGNFSILARNGIPYADTSMVNLKIHCKPRNATSKSRTIGAKIDTVENIEFQVISFPVPNVTWGRVTGFTWKIEKNRYDYRHKIHSEIRIRSEEDFGVYVINICNRLGCIVENITLKPQDKPEAPQNFSLVTTTFRSVNISWIVGFNGGHEQTFSVQFKATDDVKWDTRNVQNNYVKTGSKVYYTLDQLKPKTSYQVIVVSTNLQGQRNASLEFKTEDEPIVSSHAPPNSASISHSTVGLLCGIPPLLVVFILLVYIGRRNKTRKSDLKEKNVKSEKSDEYTIIQRNNPTFTDAYSTLQPPPESTALPVESMETNTYDECGVLANVEVYETMDDRKSGNVEDEQGSGQEKSKERMYDNMKI